MPVVYCYGFPPKMEFDVFCAEFFADFPQFKDFKVDYKMDKIYAFIHTNTQEEAQQIITRWHDKPMRNSGENKLQVRMKQEGGNNNQNNHNQNNMHQQRPNFRNNNMGGGNRGPRPNYNNNNNGMRPNMRGPRPNFNNSFNNNNYNNNMNSFNQNNGFMNQNNHFNNNNNMNNRNMNNRNNNQGNDNITIGPQKPVLYVYGFPKDMPQEEFEKIFLEGVQGTHKQTDYFQEKIYCFVHMLDNDSCDTLIDNWDTKPLQPNESATGERPKPLQVRYKGLDAKTMNLLNSIQPVLWVYGFPKGLTEDQFKQEFLLGMDCEKIDYFEQKLYCFVHMQNWKQCIKLINKWDGKLMNNSKSPLQVRFKNLNNNNKNNNNNSFGNHNNSFNNHNGIGPVGAKGDMNPQNMYNQFNNQQNQNQFYMNNMQRGNNPHQNNMYHNPRQQNYNNYNMQNNMQNNMQFMQNNRMPNNNWGGQPNMMGMQGGYAGDQGGNFRNKAPNNFQNRGHPQQFNQGGMNDGNFRNNQMQFRGSRQ